MRLSRRGLTTRLHWTPPCPITQPPLGTHHNPRHHPAPLGRGVSRPIVEVGMAANGAGWCVGGGVRGGLLSCFEGPHDVGGRACMGVHCSQSCVFGRFCTGPFLPISGSAPGGRKDGTSTKGSSNSAPAPAAPSTTASPGAAQREAAAKAARDAQTKQHKK